MARMYKFGKQETGVKNEEEEQGDENVGENPRENQEEELEAESEDMLKEILDTLKEQHQSFYGTWAVFVKGPHFRIRKDTN